MLLVVAVGGPVNKQQTLLSSQTDCQFVQMKMNNANHKNPGHNERDLDLSNASRGVWLVKIPKYIATKWEKAPANIEVAKLKITK